MRNSYSLQLIIFINIKYNIETLEVIILLFVILFKNQYYKIYILKCFVVVVCNFLIIRIYPI